MSNAHEYEILAIKVVKIKLIKKEQFNQNKYYTNSLFNIKMQMSGKFQRLLKGLKYQPLTMFFSNVMLVML